ncbi:MAG: ABC transporter permease subunit [Chloroflexota bacterium]|jgi:Cu-processing system permease protein|nr:MAG: ABC transporter permease subunit [Chloroflexota bacterium]
MLDFNNVITITLKELQDARRNRWYLIYVLVFTGLSLALAWLGMTGLGDYGLAGFGRTAASIINIVLLVVPLMGLTLGAISLAGEREKSTLLYLLAQPVTQLEVLLGKYIGLAIALFSALVLGFGISGIFITIQGGSAEIDIYLLMVLLAFMLAMVSLSLGFLISSMVRKGSTAVSIALFIWLLLLVFGDLGLMGTSIVLNLGVDQLFTLTMLNPMQIFKIAAILNIRGSLEVLGPAGIYALRTYGTALLPGLIAVLAVWTIAPMSLAYYSFRRSGAL